MKNKIFICLAILIIFFTASVNAQLFNSKISKEDLNRISSGELVIRNIEKIEIIGLNPVNPTAQKAIETMKKLNPAYLAEVIKVIPYNGNENLINELEPMLLDVQSYVGIPYFSERAQKYFDLYSSAEIKSLTKEENTTKMNAKLEMEPFGYIDTDIYMETGFDTIYYEMTNLNKQRYHDKFNCVKEQKMKSIITAFKAGDSIVLYGLGGVNAPSIFFIKERVEISFMNRIKTFCSYFFTNL